MVDILCIFTSHLTYFAVKESRKTVVYMNCCELHYCAVNDPFVVKEWEKTYCDNKHIKFLCDGSAIWTKKIGLELDLYDRGMGVRSRRYCLLVDDTIVKIANIEGGGLETSTADRIMSDLDSGKGG